MQIPGGAKAVKNDEVNAAGRKTVVLSVNQDAGISPRRNKGAAVHLNAMRAAFSGLDADCRALDEPDDVKLKEKLQAALEEGPVDLIYERYALGKSSAARFAGEHRIPLVVEVNSPLAEEQRRWRGGSSSGEDATNDAVTLAGACKIIAVSNDVARYAQDRGARPERIEVFPNGIDVDRFSPRLRAESVRQSIIPGGRFVLGFHGRERPWHGFDQLTRVMGQLLLRGLDVHLLVVGEGDFDSLSQLPEDRYTRVGWQAHEMMPRYVAAFDVLPLTYGADMPCYFSPLKLMEAMGCGVVPVVPALGDLGDVVSHLETGLVYTAGDQAQLLQQIETLISDRSLLDSLGQRAAAEAQRHSWKHIAEKALESAAFYHREELNRDPYQCLPSQGSLHSAFSDLKSLVPAEQLIRRVAIERKGTVHIEVHEAGRQRFFVYEANELRELKPGDDPRIPFASKWRESGIAMNHGIISYRPGRRIVLGPKKAKASHIIKAYKKRKTARAADNYRLVQSACAGGGFQIPELLQINMDDDFLVMEQLEGRPPLIEPGAVGEWSDVGVCLKRFQQWPADHLNTFNHGDELEVLDERARRFLLCLPALPARWQEARQKLQSAVADLPAASTGLAHRDLHDRQLIVSGESIGLLDFDLVCKADVALDPANLLAHMKLRTMQSGRGAVQPALNDCSHALLSGLGRLDECGFTHRLLFYQASTFYRLALLYALRPRWTHLTGRLIDEGNACLETFNRLPVPS